MPGGTGVFEKCLLAMPLLLLPLLFGGARPWLWSAVAAVFFSGLVIVLWKDRVSITPATVLDRHFLVPGLLLLYPFFQLVPLPASLLTLISPHRAIVLADAARASLMPVRAFTISYGTVTTLFSAFWWVFLGAFALLLQRVVRTDKGLERFVIFLFVVGFLESFYGLLQVLVPTMGVLAGQSPDSIFAGIARGTFINRNHYAAFLGMIWPVLVAYILTLRSSPDEARVGLRRRGSTKLNEKQITLVFITAMVLLSLVFSMSRGGIIGSLIALTVFIAFGRGAQWKGLLISLVGCWLIVFSYGAVIGFDGILERFQTISDDAPGRMEIWKDCRHIVEDHPLTGVGLGNNALVFDIYQTHLPDDLHASHAHNDYLQLATELGLPAAIVISLSVWFFWRKTALNLRRSCSPAHDRRRMLKLGALAGTAAFLCHSWVEFNWQIPANQLYFITLLVIMGTSPTQQPERPAQS